MTSPANLEESLDVFPASGVHEVDILKVSFIFSPSGDEVSKLEWLSERKNSRSIFDRE